jgi:hypothetical protein
MREIKLYSRSWLFLEEWRASPDTWRWAFVIFGWGHKTYRDYGPAKAHNCEENGSVEYYHLARRTQWFTIFFIPVFPYRTETILICPLCKLGERVGQKKFAHLRRLVEVHKAWLEGRITDSEHEFKVQQLTAPRQKT